MLVTILLYSGCTGLSAFATRFWDFVSVFDGPRVGGEFGGGVALVAEVMPGTRRGPMPSSLLRRCPQWETFRPP